jgi:hypothetical protein
MTRPGRADQPRSRSRLAFDDAGGVEGLELVEGDAEGVGAVVEFLELLAQAREVVGFGQGVHVRQARGLHQLEQAQARPVDFFREIQLIPTRNEFRANR